MSGPSLDKMRNLEDADVAGKRVLMRADLNVPMADGVVSDATRIERVLATIKGLTGRGAKVIILSHWGRPKGVRCGELTLRPVAEKLVSLLPEINVSFIEDCIGETAANGIAAMADGDVALLENIRFHGGEESNDESFARGLAELGDIYVNDAFSASHRAHASIEAITKILPAYPGLLMKAEVSALSRALGNPQKPVTAIVGGAKVSTKIPLLANMALKVDRLIIGGGMANTFLHAQGHGVGKSLCEPDFADMVQDIMAKAADSGCEISLPVDAVVATEFKAGASSSVCGVDDVPDDAMILDVGPQSVAKFKEQLAASKTLLWNGPLGAFEIDPFGEGTFAVAREAANLTKTGSLVTIAGGGDTVAALNAADVTSDFTYVSTAGGAFLEWLEGRDLPGVMALMTK